MGTNLPGHALVKGLQGNLGELQHCWPRWLLVQIAGVRLLNEELAAIQDLAFSHMTTQFPMWRRELIGLQPRG